MSVRCAASLSRPAARACGTGIVQRVGAIADAAPALTVALEPGAGAASDVTANVVALVVDNVAASCRCAPIAAPNVATFTAPTTRALTGLLGHRH